MASVSIQAREALLAALGRQAPTPDLTGLDGLLSAAAVEESTFPIATPVDDALVLELARVFGPSFGERAPRSAREAVLLRRGGSEQEAELRAALGPFEEELRRCLAHLERTARGPPLGAELLVALDHARIVLDRLPRPTVPRPIAPWDPLGALCDLERATAGQRDRAARALRDLHAPVRIPDGEVLSVWRWMHGGDRPASRAGLLELARALEAFCRAAPLGKDGLAELQRLARAADEERDDPDWRPLHDRLARLAPLLLGGPPLLLPLYRSRAPLTPKRAPTPRALEALVLTRDG